MFFPEVAIIRCPEPGATAGFAGLVITDQGRFRLGPVARPTPPSSRDVIGPTHQTTGPQ